LKKNIQTKNLIYVFKPIFQSVFHPHQQFLNFHLPWIETGCVQAVWCLLVVGVHSHNLHGDDDDDEDDGFSGWRRLARLYSSCSDPTTKATAVAGGVGGHGVIFERVCTRERAVMKYWRWVWRPGGRVEALDRRSGAGRSVLLLAAPAAASHESKSASERHRHTSTHCAVCRNAVAVACRLPSSIIIRFRSYFYTGIGSKTGVCAVQLAVVT